MVPKSGQKVVKKGPKSHFLTDFGEVRDRFWQNRDFQVRLEGGFENSCSDLIWTPKYHVPGGVPGGVLGGVPGPLPERSWPGPVQKWVKFNSVVGGSETGPAKTCPGPVKKGVLGPPDRVLSRFYR